MSAEGWVAIITAVGAVLHSLVRELRVMRDMRELRLNDEARLEQTARRDRKRRDSDVPAARRAVPRSEFDEQPTTDIHEIRRELSSRGLRAPRPGTHHDKER